jgi:hypothetical protein
LVRRWCNIETNPEASSFILVDPFTVNEISEIIQDKENVS